ncbi:hypothetical protein C900_04479 [Fulvivirga imtechensis AK7]|uniref:SPW repeat-containing integral membrane domain-containing protein n=1 Tax=Fulvivirga imtechensis AK7 TaxID=1237149 RepID=L8JLZ3_9BACT|nr:SPW repeat protein [Fulvivirga imtechensis]ELR69956.1 hypothetical protein C900_04479 [Fulvivirga imtechensis AK7]
MWAQIVNVVIGIWIMASPGILNYPTPAAADNNHIVGPLIVTFAFTAIWEATRTVGKWNIPLGLWLIIAPWILDFEDNTEIVGEMAAGIVVTALAMVKGKIEQRFGGGWSSLFSKHPEHKKALEKGK